jgi:geranylgeranyl diphosphate synthase type II
MKAITRIEQSLAMALAAAEDASCPPKLASAVRHAVFPGGARIRPQLCLAVAQACGQDDPALSEAAAVAIELLHCASLVHDDLPCFDDAPTRRGRASVHWAFGQPLAVLAGDESGMETQPSVTARCTLTVLVGVKPGAATAVDAWRPA